ncbi:hypothetical protein ACFPTO_02210 [Paraburkholderia denitrificans]|uniref:Uncharacterized protein n=1 Tax=Paraburkholderia denitrificans TaxID=694025 RepID=A0ABW0J3K6_9BURK
MSKTTQRTREGNATKPLKVQIADARSALNDKLIRGEDTVAMRQYLSELLEKQKHEDAAEAAQTARQQAAADAERDRILASATVLAEARDARIANAIRFDIGLNV